MARLSAWLLLCVVLSSLSLAQGPVTGLPPFGSFQSAGFDTVNLQNLNTNFSIPIVSVPGRGTNFSFSIVFDSLLWQKSGTTWQPVIDGSGNPNWGWKKDVYGGVTSYTKVTQNIHCSDGGNGILQTWSNFAYRDPFGTVHRFTLRHTDSSCDSEGTTGSAYSSDLSGYFMNTTDWDNPIAVSPGGFQSPYAGSVVDENGNLISKIVVSSTENDWKDTAGRIVLKVITGSNFIQYQFQDTTGAYQTATLNYLSPPYTIATNFGCSGMTNYTGTSTVNLPGSLQLPNGKQYTFTYEQTPGLGTGFTTGRVQRVTLPTGGYYEFGYPGANDSVNCADGTTTSLTRTVNNGATSATWQFARSGISGSAGTTTITAPTLPYDATANQTTVLFDANGHETTRKIYQGTAGGTPLRTIITTWAANGTPATQVTVLEDNSTQSETDTTYDSNGNLRVMSDYDWGSGARGPLQRTTNLTYLSTTPYTSRNIVNRLTSLTVKDGAGVFKYRQDTAYDEAGYINTSCPAGAAQHDDTGHGCAFTVRGNPTTVTTYKDPTTPANGVSKHFRYDWFGNLRQADLNCCQQKTWNYSAATQYAYGDSVVSGASSPQLSQSFTYNPYTGQLASTTDENNQLTTYAYDSMKRLLTVTRSDGTQLTTTYDDTALTVTTTTPITSSTALKQIGYMDGLGRAIKSVTADAASASYSIVEQQYDPVGRAYKTSNPHNSTAQYWTESRFDALGRPKVVIPPNGSASSNNTSYSYSLKTVTIADPAGHQRKNQADGLGRLATVYEPDGSNNLTLATSYSYTVLNSLATVTQGVQTRTYGYDNLGRLTSVATPETANVAYQYQYNDFGLLTQRTDPRGVVTTYTYDTLNRPYQISYNVGSTGVPATSTVTYTYGTSQAQNNNGRLITMTDGVGSEGYTYDILGRVTQLQKIISGTTYTTSYGYNLASQLTSTTYPSNRVVQQNYDAIGRLCAIAAMASTCGSYTTPYATGFAYNAALETTGFTYGNGLTATLGYSADRLQLQSLTYKQGTTTLFGLTYGYSQPNSGNNGQITSITDTVQSGRTVNYTYDPLGRLGAATTTGSTAYPQWGLSWVYDRYGNRTQQNLTAGTAPSPQTPADPTTNRLNASGYTYDANGNLKVEPLPTPYNYAYDGENRMVNFTGSSGGTYSYDGNSLRVKKVSSGTTTVYIFSGTKVIAEYSNGTLNKEYVYSGNQFLATIASTGVVYRLTDHLSARLGTDASGTVIRTFGHFPFGETWYETGSTSKWKFTSYEQDAESGNDYAMARYDINRVGRFASPDPISGSIGNPQSLNRYAYVGNNPINAIDPLGMDCTIIGPDGTQQPCGGGGGGTANPGFCSPSQGNCFGPDGPWGRGGGGGSGGAGVEICGVNPYCIRNGGIGPFGSPVAQVLGSDGNYFVGSWADATVTSNGVYINATVHTDYYSKRGEYLWTVISKYINLIQYSGPTNVSMASYSWWNDGRAEAVGYLESHPITGSVNEIVAAQITYQRSTKTICGGLGLGASVPPSKAVTVGILNEGDMAKWQDVASSWGYSFGANLLLGYQGSFNSSGALGGPTVSGVGLSGSYTYGGCRIMK